MKKFIITALFALLPAARAAAQERFIFLPDQHFLTCRKWLLVDSITTDTSLIKVFYDQKVIQDPDTGTGYESVAALLAGRRFTDYYSVYLRLSDKVWGRMEFIKKNSAAAVGAGISAELSEEEKELSAMSGYKCHNSEIWIDKQKQTLCERLHSYESNNLSIEYEEQLPVFEWEFLPETDSLHGYSCLKATADFRGRKWTVWFTTEIPVNAGPWKFNGLPGLILKAEDSEGHYKWECRSIEQKQEPIIFYMTERSRKMDRERAMKYLKNFHDNPLATINTGVSTEVKIHGHKEALTDSWTLPYNPIER